MSDGYIIFTLVQPTNIKSTHVSNAAFAVIPGDELVTFEAYRSH
jgi:hypothetical protein